MQKINQLKYCLVLVWLSLIGAYIAPSWLDPQLSPAILAEMQQTASGLAVPVKFLFVALLT